MKLSVSAFRGAQSSMRGGGGAGNARKATPISYHFDGGGDDGGGGRSDEQQQPTFPVEIGGPEMPNKESEMVLEVPQVTHVDETSSNLSKGKVGGLRTRSNQRWMKLRTTVQLTGAMTSTIQKQKPQLKREDSFLKRFSTRQIPDTQETLDTGDEGENDSSSGDEGGVGIARRWRKRKHRKKQPLSVVNPDENFYFYWLCLLAICVLYNLWTLIVRQSFPEFQRKAENVWWCCDNFTDLVFVLDIAVQFRTGYLEQGLMVYNSRKLAKHYAKSRAFILDMLAMLPLQLLQYKIGTNPILRFPRFIKVYRVYHYYYMVESRTVYPNFWRVINLIHILLILAHWFGCFYYLLSEAEGFKGDWVYPYKAGDYATLSRKYLGSLYWSTLTLTTIGDLPTPETDIEYIFTIVSYLIGVFIFATIVGQVGNVITNRNANRLEFERLLDGAKTYMRHHKVPNGMKRRVLRWYDYSWSRGRIQGGGDINTALGLLPDKLKTELALHVNLSVLKKVTIFQECQPEFLHDLVLKMKAYIFTPGDLICRKGEVAREMFIIADGILEVISETGYVLTTMMAGDFFGEIGILNLDGLNKRTADVRSVGYSELFSLSREDVLAAMKDYPEAQEILQTLGRKRLMEARNATKCIIEQRKQAALNAMAAAVREHSKSKIVDRIYSDVKGLKSVLRKSHRGTKANDNLELVSSTSTNLPSKGECSNLVSQPVTKKSSLCRSPNVKSDENTSEGEQSWTERRISAGFPLLNKLKILTDKHQQASKQQQQAEYCDQEASKGKKKEEDEVVGAGLPLLQRLLLLKQKQEADGQTKQNSATQTTKSCRGAKKEVAFADGKMAEDADIKRTKPWILLKRATFNHSSVKRDNNVQGINNNKHRPSNRLNTIRLQFGTKAELDKKGMRSEMGAKLLKSKLSLPLRLSDRPYKRYDLVDDLSPEYQGLPFVKRLKILNERQKLAQLEESMLIRSRSVGDDHNTPGRCFLGTKKLAGVRRSLSDGRYFSPEEDFPSPSSGETLERRRLKGVLKKISSGQCHISDIINDNDDDNSIGYSDSAELLKKLMSSPTIQGYVARHSTFEKGSTFSTIQSPPPPPPPVEAKVANDCFKEKDADGQSGDPDLISNLTALDNITDNLDCSKLIQETSEMRDLFDSKIREMEQEVMKRDIVIDILQTKIRDLKKHLVTCNCSLDSCDDYTIDQPVFMRGDSTDTILMSRPAGSSRDAARYSAHSRTSQGRNSWKVTSAEESLELRDLPSSTTLQSVWKPDVRIDISASTASEGDEIFDETGVLADHDQDWEIRMLARELERRESRCEIVLQGMKSTDKSTPPEDGMLAPGPSQRSLSSDNIYAEGTEQRADAPTRHCQSLSTSPDVVRNASHNWMPD